jgi:hypothetical protein
VGVSKVGGKYVLLVGGGEIGRIWKGRIRRNEMMDRLEIPLTDEQEEHAKRIYAALKQKADEELRNLARMLASKEDHQLFGETEFQVRDGVHRIGAVALEAAANERKKGVPR